MSLEGGMPETHTVGRKLIPHFVPPVCSPPRRRGIFYAAEGGIKMKLKLAENIRAFRKARHETQEQLAEAMGVSVSAVYKWESGLSVPEVGLILKLADLFHTSTDVLLGYEWTSDDLEAALEKIKTFAKAKQYQEAVQEAEKLLCNYPNHFAVVYPCAQLYLEMGREREHREANRRAIQLLEHACELIDRTRTRPSVRCPSAPRWPRRIWRWTTRRLRCAS